MADLDLTPAALNLRLYRGDSTTIKVTLQDTTTGNPVALPTTGWTAQLRKAKDSDVVVDVCSVNATQAATGILFVTFPDTTLLESPVYYDVQCSTGGVRTYLKGRVTISQDVTRA